jgi:CSLREA domain-containing protein
MKITYKVLHLILIAGMLAMFVAARPSQQVYASGIVVNTATDEDVDNSDCSLREAIIAANTDAAYRGCSAGSGADTITFAGNYTITLAGSQLPYIYSPVIVKGNGTANTIIQANENPNVATYRVFTVANPFGDFTLDGVTVRHGRCNGSCFLQPERGGGIFSNGFPVTILNSVISNNSANYYGGGLDVYYGDLTIINSTFSGNSADNGGAIRAGGVRTLISGSSFIDNTAIYDGGAVYSNGSIIQQFTIINSIFYSNDANFGGGLYSDSIIADVSNSTFSENAAMFGGGIYNFGSLSLTNSTIYNNSASFAGGGIGISGSSPRSVTISNSTIDSNSSPQYGGGISIYNTTTLYNTIISNNTGSGDCYIGNNINLTANGHNIDTDGSCGGATQKTSGELNFDALSNNGGLTQTIALLNGSHAIDAGDDAICLTSPVNNLDQRGITRPQGSHCDVGAYEYDSTPTVTSITRANANPTNAASVDFTVTFSEAVDNVNTADFSLNTSGVSGASITSVTGSGTTRTVSVNTGSGSGTLRLDIPNSATITDLAGNAVAGLPYTSGESYTISDNAPTVTSIIRASANPTSANSVNFTVTFSESVNGIGIEDFSITETGAITGESVTSVNGSGSVYTVSINTGSGSGTLRLDIPNTASITDSRSNSLTSLPYTSGESYTISDDVPSVSSITRASANPTSATSVDFSVTFSEPVTGVDTGDFTLATTGLTGASISAVSGSGASYTVTAFTGYKPGTLRLDLINNSSIVDVRNNPLTAGNFTTGETYTINKSPTFSDVPFDYWSWRHIESLYNSGITGGCSTNPLSYCPTSSVTRAQMAVFLLKGIHGSSFAPPAVNGSTGFTDVATNYWAVAWIKQLAAEGITGGCGVGIYCPENTVTRDQMAVFLLKAKYGSSYAPPAVNGDTGFTDVPVDYWAAAWIKQLAAEAITGGCGSGVYCPANPVTRDQMAVFLQRTFNLPLP